MTRIATVLNISETFGAYVSADNRAKWAQANPNAAKIVGMIEKERLKQDLYGSAS